MPTKKQLTMKNHRHAKIQQKQPGLEYKMNSLPGTINKQYKGSNKLVNKVTIITDDSGQFPQSDITKITALQMLKTFSINIFSNFYMEKAALSHLDGQIIICLRRVYLI